jgi:hypothetical protein
MATKKFFDGEKLHEVELPDIPLPDVLNVRGRDALDALAINPTGVDVTTLPVDVTAMDNLRPTDGAVPSQKFPDPLPGNGEGPGIGQPSGLAMRDPWQNNPNRDNGTTTVNADDAKIGEALAPSVAEAAERTALKLKAQQGDKTALKKLQKLDEEDRALTDLA